MDFYGKLLSRERDDTLFFIIYLKITHDISSQNSKDEFRESSKSVTHERVEKRAFSKATEISFIHELEIQILI